MFVMNQGLHIDKVSSHTSKSTAAYLAKKKKKKSETGINFNPFNEIPLKLLNGLRKMLEEEWDKNDMTVLRKNELSWNFQIELSSRIIAIR